MVEKLWRVECFAAPGKLMSADVVETHDSPESAHFNAREYAPSWPCVQVWLVEIERYPDGGSTEDETLVWDSRN